MPLPLLAASALVGAPKFLLGAYQTFQAFKGLKNLNDQPEPNYTVSPELQRSYTRADGMASQGFDPAQQAAFQQNLARASNTAYQRAMDLSGGSMGNAINAAVQYNNINSLNQFAADDAEQRMNNIRYADSIASQMQQQKNMATQVDIDRRFQKEQAYGGALKSGLENLAGSASQAAAMGIGVPAMQANNGRFMGGYQTPVNPFGSAPYVPPSDSLYPTANSSYQSAVQQNTPDSLAWAGYLRGLNPNVAGVSPAPYTSPGITSGLNGPPPLEGAANDYMYAYRSL